jgi:hypothetical protein
MAEAGMDPSEAVAQGYALTAAEERRDPVTAELNLLTRRAELTAEGQRIYLADAASKDIRDACHAYSDKTDEALALIAHWHRSHPGYFDEYQDRFFRLGLKVYGNVLQSFLPEFIFETLDSLSSPSSALTQDAITALEAALTQLIEQGQLEIEPARSTYLLDTARQLEIALEELKERSENATTSSTRNP